MFIKTFATRFFFAAYAGSIAIDLAVAKAARRKALRAAAKAARSAKGQARSQALAKAAKASKRTSKRPSRLDEATRLSRRYARKNRSQRQLFRAALVAAKATVKRAAKAAKAVVKATAKVVERPVTRAQKEVLAATKKAALEAARRMDPLARPARPFRKAPRSLPKPAALGTPVSINGWLNRAGLSTFAMSPNKWGANDFIAPDYNPGDVSFEEEAPAPTLLRGKGLLGSKAPVSTAAPVALTPAASAPASASDKPLTKEPCAVASATQSETITNGDTMTTAEIKVVMPAEAVTLLAAKQGSEVPLATLFTPEEIKAEAAAMKAAAKMGVANPILAAAFEPVLVYGAGTKAHPVVEQHTLHYAFLTAVLAMRKGQPFTLPSNVKVGPVPGEENAYYATGIVPKGLRKLIPGGEALHRLVSWSYKTNSYVVENMGESFGTAYGCKEFYVGDKIHNPERCPKAFKVAAVITAKARKDQGGAVIGYSKRDARTLANQVVEAFRYKDLPCAIYVPEATAKALEIFFRYAENSKGAGYTKAANFIGVEDNWLTPLAGLSFDEVKGAFRYLQMFQNRELKNAVAKNGHAPFTYVETEEGFELYLAGGSKFAVLKGEGSVEPVAYFMPSSSTNWLRIRGLLVGTANCLGEYQAGQVTKMSSLDVFWYIWEAFGFQAMNRRYNTTAQTLTTLKDASLGATDIQRFIQKNIPVEMEETLRGSKVTHRQIFTGSNYTTTVLAMAMPFTFVGAPGACAFLPGDRYASSWNDGEKAEHRLSGINSYFGLLKIRAGVAAKGNAIAMIKVANEQFGLAILPIGSCTDFVEHHICAVRYDAYSPSTSKELIISAFIANWKDWGFLGKEGFADITAEGVPAEVIEVNVAKALNTNVKLAKMLAKHRVSPEDVTNPEKATKFWTLVAKNLVAQHSNKVSKAIKRAVINFATVCELEKEQKVGWEFVGYAGQQDSMGMLVPAALMFNGPVADPGMGEVAKDYISALFSVKRDIKRVTVPTNTDARFELSADLAEGAEPMFTGSGHQIGWKIAEGRQVTKGDLLGYIVLGEVVRHEARAHETGRLKDITWRYSTEMSSSAYFTAFATVRIKESCSLKLRDGQKTNAVAKNLNYSLGYCPEGFNKKAKAAQALNGDDFGGNTKIFIPQDCYKGTDNFTFILRLIGANYSYYATTHEAIKALLVKTNAAVFAALGIEAGEKSNALVISDAAKLAGCYDEIVADFNARFRRAIWHYQESPEVALAEIIASQTYNKALATVKAAANVSGDKWRLVGADEAATIKGEAGVGLSKALLAQIANGSTATSFIATNAVDASGKALAITDDHSIAAVWTIDGFDHQGYARPMYQILVRANGWGRKDGMDFLYPTQVEYTTIPQSVSSTSIMAFAMLDNAMRGSKDLAMAQADSVESSMELDRLFNTFLTLDARAPKKVMDSTGSISPVVQLGTGVKVVGSPVAPGVQEHLGKVVTASQFFTAEAMAALTSKEVAEDDYAFMKALAYYAGNYIFILPTEQGGSTSAHIGTIFSWSGGSLKASGQSAISFLLDFFKNWILKDANPHNAECQTAAGNYHRLLVDYTSGKNYTKALLRGSDTVYLKAAASCIVPNDELWIVAKDVPHFCRVFGVESIDEVTHVGFRRMPMFRSNVSKLRVISREEANAIQKKYGIWLSAGRAYMGAGQMYSNFGDLDGDAIEIDNLSTAVAAGQIAVDDFGSIKSFLALVLGVNVFAVDYWFTGVADQYVADHFHFMSLKKYFAKASCSFEKNLVSLESFAEFQKAAATVQTLTVGATYSAATLSAMFAEILSAVWPELEATGDASWVSNFAWALDSNKCMTNVYKLLSLYEVALGGYDPAMAKATLGYLVRAMNGDEDVTTWTLLDEIKAKISGASSINETFPLAKNAITFNHVPEEEVVEALVDLGFAKEDFFMFRDCFLMAGLSKQLPGRFEELEYIPPTMILILNIIQTVLDVTQGKLRGISGESTALESFMKLEQAVAGPYLNSEVAAPAEVQNYLSLRNAIMGKTVTGKLFARYYNNCLAKVNEASIVVGALPAVAQ
jgi:hypothetical protein